MPTTLLKLPRIIKCTSIFRHAEFQRISDIFNNHDFLNHDFLRNCNILVSSIMLILNIFGCPDIFEKTFSIFYTVVIFDISNEFDIPDSLDNFDSLNIF